jgi:7-cyano-7-deazaguanine tRNA-ribosyltransferase
MTKNARVLLLLPCTNKKPYTEAPTWKFIAKHIEPWHNQVDIAAVDCITNPVNGLPFGIVTQQEQYLTVDKDERPSPEKIPVLIEEIRKKLDLLSPQYDHIISYINVKSYWKAIEALKTDYNIKMLPRAYMKDENWKGKVSHMGPIGMFKVCVCELKDELSKATSEPADNVRKSP